MRGALRDSGRVGVRALFELALEALELVSLRVAARTPDQSAEDEQESPKESARVDDGLLGDASPRTAEVLEAVRHFEVELSLESTLGEGRWLVARHDASELHALSALLRDATKRRPHTAGLLLDDLVFDDRDAPLWDVGRGVVEHLGDRTIDLDAGFGFHGRSFVSFATNG